MSIGVDTAAARNLASCHRCYKLADAQLHYCPRCGSALHLRKKESLQRTLAYLITATILYLPANIYPIMVTEQLGRSDESTILGGVVLLIKLGSIPVATIIFFASVVVPLGKFMALYYLLWTVRYPQPAGHRQRTSLYKITEFIGKWSMVDVFVVAILVALVHLGGVLEIRPGIAALSFAAMVMLTMLAAESFDPRLIWDHLETDND